MPHAGTDATIAEHIAKIIERQYVIEKQEQKVKYLLPSLLGIGLVEGFNRVGLDRSLSKPQLRAEVGCSPLHSDERNTDLRIDRVFDGTDLRGRTG